MPRGYPYTREVRRACLADYEDGIDIWEIYRFYGPTPSTIHTWWLSAKRDPEWVRHFA